MYVILYFPRTKTTVFNLCIFCMILKACRNTEQYSLIALNLCVVYIRMGESRKAKVDEYKR